MHIENKIRVENGIPLREFYGIVGGAGVGRALIPGTRFSANYTMGVRLGNRTRPFPFIY